MTIEPRFLTAWERRDYEHAQWGEDPLGPLDPRDPDYSRVGIFQTHNCYKCQHGTLPCLKGHPHKCDYPHARND